MEHMREVQLVHAAVTLLLEQLCAIDSEAFLAESATVRINSRQHYAYDVKVTRHGTVSVQPQRPEKRTT